MELPFMEAVANNFSPLTTSVLRYLGLLHNDNSALEALSNSFQLSTASTKHRYLGPCLTMTDQGG